MSRQTNEPQNELPLGPVFLNTFLRQQRDLDRALAQNHIRDLVPVVNVFQIWKVLLEEIDQTGHGYQGTGKDLGILYGQSKEKLAKKGIKAIPRKENT